VKGTWESLDAMLIAISPEYVKAMGEELNRRFQGFSRVDEDQEGGHKDDMQDL
jgi:hypothetical protein